MCILKAFSSSRSFKGFAETTAIPVYSCYEKGEPRSPNSSKLSERFSISFDVSTKEWDEFPGQVEDSIVFLQKWELELSRFSSQFEPECFYLDFPLYSRLDDNIINQNDHLPKELIRLAGKLGLGIEMAIYSKEAVDDL